MPIQQPNDDITQPQEPGGESPQKKPVFTLNLTIMLLLFVIALGEVLVVYFYVLPSPTAVQASIEETAAKQDVKTKAPYKPQIDETMQEEERDEVDLGEHTFYESDTTNMPLRFSIRLYGLVNKKDREEFNKRYENHKNRISNAILVILRSSKQTEITDPTLGVVKNKIMVKVNEILGMPLVKGVIYTDIAVQTGG